MASRAEIDRLRLEADTIMTRHAQVERALDRARSEPGDHWETGELTVTLDTPRGDPIDVTLALDADAAGNARSRYERAGDLEADLEREERIAERLAPLPADPVAYLLCYHLDSVGGNYPRSIAGHLDARRDCVDALCGEMETAGLLDRVESGTVKRRRVKAKQADEVRQHHTYYRLSRAGDHLLRFLDEPAGRVNVLRHLPDGRALVERVARDGPDTPRATAEDLGLAFERVRHLYRALRQVGLVAECEGDTGRAHACYAATDRGEEALRATAE